MRRSIFMALGLLVACLVGPLRPALALEGRIRLEDTELVLRVWPRKGGGLSDAGMM